MNPPQTLRETWPSFNQYFYKTTNSIYGSSTCSQPPSCSLFPASLRPFGIHTPSMSEVSGVVDSSLTEARTQEAGVAGENGPFLCEEEKGQLHYVFGGEANVLEQLEAKDEPQQMIDVLCEEGEIVLSSHAGLACCDDFLRCVCREARLQHLLRLPVACSPIITVKDAENWAHCACVRGLGPAIGLKNSFFLQPTSRQCCCCEWQSESPNHCFFEVQTFPPCIPHSSILPPAHVQPTFYCTVPSRKPPLTEYQARYTAEWAQPKMQQCYIHHHHPSCTKILDPSC
uniref:uncharacterized protein LOC117272772 n=1 Tax=Epinephelus lanceolatus TaxID=310571 RepID=UPI0014471AD4|nr:uncharacterized protein LOC117272772 [Epinephelus lanceolatus]